MKWCCSREIFFQPFSFLLLLVPFETQKPCGFRSLVLLQSCWCFFLIKKEICGGGGSAKQKKHVKTLKERNGPSKIFFRLPF